MKIIRRFKMGLFSIFKSKKKKEEALKYKIGMEKTRKSSAFSRLANLFNGHNKIDEELFDELEEIFVMADIGIDTVVKFVEELKSDEKVKTAPGAGGANGAVEMVQTECFSFVFRMGLGWPFFKKVFGGGQGQRPLLSLVKASRSDPQ